MTSVLKSVTDAFEGENVQTQHSDLGYRIDLYFHDYKLSIEVDEEGHKDRNISHQIQRQKVLEKNLVVNLLGLILIKKILIFSRL